MPSIGRSRAVEFSEDGVNFSIPRETLEDMRTELEWEECGCKWEHERTPGLRE